MTGSESWGGIVRKLWSTERDKLRDHFLRLDKEHRRLRFGHAVSDTFLEEYASRVNDLNSVVYGYFEGDEMRAVAELRKMGPTWGREAEAAFSVEPAIQNQGIGTELMGLVIRAARNRGVHHLYVTCLAENSKMQNIARKHHAVLLYEHGDVKGEIVPKAPSAISVLEEAIDDQRAYAQSILDLNPVRAVQAVA